MGKFFVSRPVFAIAISIALVILGAVSITGLSIEQYPDITPPVVEVTAQYSGADAETVNNAVATPIAQSVMGVSDMLYMESTSANDGSMTLQVTFDIGSDVDMDAIFTQNNVSSAMAQLPAAVTRQGVTTRKSMSGFLMVYALHSDGRYDDSFVANYAYINLENELLKINGVGKVSIMGAGEYAMRVWLYPDRLDYFDISIDEISTAIASQGGIFPAGQFGAEPSPEGVTYTYTVTMPPQISTPEEFSRIILRANPDGDIIRLGDVAMVELGSNSYGTSSLFDGKPSALIVIYQEPGSNAVEVGSNVKSVMDRLSAKFPDGLQIETIVDTTASIGAGIKDIFVTLVVALLLVILIIYLFLQDWRATLIPLIAIPVSLIGTFAVFPILDFSINIISLLGLVLAIGLVVDDAIVVVEAVKVNLERGMEIKSATIEAMNNVSSPIIATTVVLLAVFIPVSLTGGITGLLFQQFAVTISVSVVISAINALTLSPALCSLLLKPTKGQRGGLFAKFNRWFDKRMEQYSLFTARIVEHTWRTLCFTVAVIIAIVITWQAIPSGFLPDEDQGFLMVAVSTPEASSLEVTERAMTHIDHIIRSMPEVEATSYAAGFNMISGTASTDSGVIFVSLVDYSKRKQSAMELATLLTEELYEAVPEAQSYAFIPPSIPGLGITSGISIEVLDIEGRGGDYLAEQTMRLIDSLEKQPEIASATTQYNDGIPRRRLVIDNEHLIAEGVSPQTLYEELSAMLGGNYVNNFTLYGRLFQTYIQAAPEYRLDNSSLNSYFVENSQAESIPLATFVEVRDTVGVGYITQFNLNRSISVDVTPAKGYSSAQAMQAIEQTAEKTLPDDISTQWSGVSYQESQSSNSSWVAYLLALIFVFLALASLYNSWGLPLSILFGVPLAVLGATLFIFVAHLFEAKFVNDIYVQISLVMLIGLAAKNAILVVEYADRIYTKGNRTLAEAAIGAARERVRPIIMTAFAFILGVMPLIFADGVYSTARNIMGVALVGGMLLATLLGIFTYPALYYMIAKLTGYEQKRNAR